MEGVNVRMASMNRNLNLEEVNSDAFMGIPFLNHQTVMQKVIFWGSIASCVIFNLAGNFFFRLGTAATSIITLVPLALGVAFGCNYNEDLSLIRYLILILSRPSKVYVTKPTEDLEQLHKSEERLKNETELEEQKKVTPEQQKQLLIKFIVGVVIGIIFLIIIMVVLNQPKEEELHHTISMVYQNRNGV